MKVHPARTLPRELVSEVLPAGPDERFDPVIETLWMPGEPLDGEALKQRLHARKPTGPICPNCGAELVPGGEFCPRCLGPVAAIAAQAEPSAAKLPPLAAMAQSDLVAPEEDEAEEAPAHCLLHPANVSTGNCNRCGNYFCDECASNESAGLCAKCEKELRSSPVVTAASQVYQDAAFAHLGVFALLVLRPFIGVVLEYRHVFTVYEALPFAGLGLLLFGVRKPLSLLVALVVDLLALADAYSTDDWSRLVLCLIPLALTSMLWLRLPDPDELPRA
jgi:uncharacterized OB-fold protein